jgi:hypothetical protein
MDFIQREKGQAMKNLKIEDKVRLVFRRISLWLMFGKSRRGCKAKGREQ